MYNVDDVLEFGLGSDSVLSFIATKTGENVSSFLVTTDFAEPLLSSQSIVHKWRLLDTYSRRFGEEPDDAKEHEQRDDLELSRLRQYETFKTRDSALTHSNREAPLESPTTTIDE